MFGSRHQEDLCKSGQACVTAVGGERRPRLFVAAEPVADATDRLQAFAAEGPVDLVA
jgi:hypothetical protein